MYIPTNWTGAPPDEPINFDAWFGLAQHEREADARENMRCARNVDAPLDVFARPENY